MAKIYFGGVVEEIITSDEFSLEKAREYISRAGYSDADGDGFVERNRQELEIEFIIRSDTTGNMRIAELLKKRLAEAGIRLTLRPVDYTLFRTITDKEKTHTMFLSRTTPWGMMMWAGSGSGYVDERNIGWSRCDSPEFHRIVDHMNTALDADTYKAAAGELQMYYAEYLPVVPLYWNVLIQPYNKQFEGWQEGPMYGFLNKDTWFYLSEVKQ